MFTATLLRRVLIGTFLMFVLATAFWQGNNKQIVNSGRQQAEIGRSRVLVGGSPLDGCFAECGAGSSTFPTGSLLSQANPCEQACINSHCSEATSDPDLAADCCEVAPNSLACTGDPSSSSIGTTTGNTTGTTTGNTTGTTNGTTNGTSNGTTTGTTDGTGGSSSSGNSSSTLGSSSSATSSSSSSSSCADVCGDEPDFYCTPPVATSVPIVGNGFCWVSNPPAGCNGFAGYCYPSNGNAACGSQTCVANNDPPACTYQCVSPSSSSNPSSGGSSSGGTSSQITFSSSSILPCVNASNSSALGMSVPGLKKSSPWWIPFLGQVTPQGCVTNNLPSNYTAEYLREEGLLRFSPLSGGGFKVWNLTNYNITVTLATFDVIGSSDSNQTLYSTSTAVIPANTINSPYLLPMAPPPGTFQCDRHQFDMVLGDCAGANIQIGMSVQDFNTAVNWNEDGLAGILNGINTSCNASSVSSFSSVGGISSVSSVISSSVSSSASITSSSSSSASSTSSAPPCPSSSSSRSSSNPSSNPSSTGTTSGIGQSSSRRSSSSTQITFSSSSTGVIGSSSSSSSNSSSTTTVCHLGVTTVIPANTLSTHLGHGDTQGACPTSSSSSSNTTTVCHLGVTTVIPANTLSTHLGHGDTQGACPTSSSSSSNTTTVCHLGVTTVIPANTLSTHLGHGDMPGACITVGSSSSSSNTTTICHLGVTTVIPANTLSTHLGHGDAPGACITVGSSSSSSSTGCSQVQCLLANCSSNQTCQLLPVNGGGLCQVLCINPSSGSSSSRTAFNPSFPNLPNVPTSSFGFSSAGIPNFPNGQTGGVTGGTTGGNISGSTGGTSGGTTGGQVVVANPYCGDGVVQQDLGEQCDQGDICSSNPDSCNRAPATLGASCACQPNDPNCAALPGVIWQQGCVTALCGDSVTSNPFLLDGRAVNFQGITELCDNGSDNGAQGNPCTSTCQLSISSFCGNGTVDTGEQCDLGTQNSDTQPDTCRTTCSNYRCGDSVIDSGEQCDDGNLQNGDGCSSICTAEQPSAPTTVAQVIDLPLLPAMTLADGTIVTGDITNIATSHAPVGQQGPGAIAAIAAGAAAGVAWVRRRRMKVS